MDLKSKSCQDLNNKLAIYRAFRNTHELLGSCDRWRMNTALFKRQLFASQRIFTTKKVALSHTLMRDNEGTTAFPKTLVWQVPMCSP